MCQRCSESSEIEVGKNAIKAKDFEQGKLYRKYMEKFQGVKYQGVYVYPQKRRQP